MSDIEEAERILREVFGLNKYETQAYLALVKGARTPKQVSKLSNVPMPRIYDVLASLESKGFAIRVDDGFAPLNPETIVSTISKKLASELEERISLIRKGGEQLSKILGKYSLPPSEGEVIVLRGLPLIVEHFAQLLLNAHDVILLIRKAIEVKEFFINQVTNLNKEKLPRIRALLHSEVNLEKRDLELASMLGVELRRSDDVMFDMMIVDDRTFVMGIPDPTLENLNERVVAIIIQNKIFVSVLRSYIEKRWSLANKINIT